MIKPQHYSAPNDISFPQPHTVAPVQMLSAFGLITHTNLSPNQATNTIPAFSNKQPDNSIGGQTRAVRQVINNYRDGFRCVAQVDIKRCYPSFNSVRTGLFFALPEKVAANSLGMQNLKLWPSAYVRKEWLHLSGSEDAPRILDLFLDRFDDEFATARPGLIEGSMASPFIVEMLLAPICQRLRTSGQGRVVCYADNFLLMAETPDALLAMERRLRDELLARIIHDAL